MWGLRWKVLLLGWCVLILILSSWRCLTRSLTLHHIGQFEGHSAPVYRWYKNPYTKVTGICSRYVVVSLVAEHSWAFDPSKQRCVLLQQTPTRKTKQTKILEDVFKPLILWFVRQFNKSNIPPPKLDLGKGLFCVDHRLVKHICNVFVFQDPQRLVHGSLQSDTRVCVPRVIWEFDFKRDENLILT